MQKLQTIKSIKEFKRLASRHKGVSYHIRLNFGAQSSKWAQFIPSSKRYVIDNFIDNSHVIMTEKQFSNSITAQAIPLGAAILEG